MPEDTQPIDVTIVGDELRTASIAPEADGTIRIPLDGPPGLYQLSVVMDARDYDWDILYETLDKFHNRGQLTGPWDFSINHGTVPVVPAYRVALNGQSLGLWYAARISVEDLDRKRFRGRLALMLDQPGELTLIPFREMNVRWQSAVLEPDPEDVIEPLPEGILTGAHSPAAQWADPAFWAEASSWMARTTGSAWAPSR